MRMVQLASPFLLYQQVEISCLLPPFLSILCRLSNLDAEGLICLRSFEVRRCVAALAVRKRAKQNGNALLTVILFIFNGDASFPGPNRPLPVIAMLQYSIF